MLQRYQPWRRQGWRYVRPPARFMGTTPSGMDHTSYCKDFVRQHDYASYLISQFYPKDAQSGYFALKAFSVRMKKTYGSVVVVDLLFSRLNWH
jgi:hypothetical protein